MVGKDKKKKDKKAKLPKNKAVEAPEDKTTLADIINAADQAVVITSNKGNIEVTGIKAINYAYQVKGLLVGAMDTYNSRPVINGLNNNTRALLAHLNNLSTKVDKIVAAINEEVPEAVKEEGKE